MLTLRTRWRYQGVSPLKSSGKWQASYQARYFFLRGRERGVSMLKYVRMHAVSFGNRIEAPFWIQLIAYCILVPWLYNFNQFQIYLACMDWLPIIATWVWLSDVDSSCLFDGFRDSWDQLFLAMQGQIPGLLWHGSFVTKRLRMSQNDSFDRRCRCCMMLLRLLSCHAFGWLYHRSPATNQEEPVSLTSSDAAPEFSYLT